MGDACELLKELLGVWLLTGGSGAGIEGREWCIPMLFLGHFTKIPIPPSPKKILFRFTLISRMDMGVGKKSEIRLKSEGSVPCKSKSSNVQIQIHEIWQKWLNSDFNPKPRFNLG